MKVIDTSVTATCPKGYTSLDWNKNGPAGQLGPQGPQGSSFLSSDGPPGGQCTSGDTDVDLTTGDVYTCNNNSEWWARLGADDQLGAGFR